MTGTEIGVAVGFYGLGALAVVAALGIMLSRNLLHAVLFLVLCFIALAGLFVTLTADFIAVAQVLIYAGAVGVLIVFAVMLTPRSSAVNADTAFFGPGFVVGGLVATMMAFVAMRTPWRQLPESEGGFETTVAAIGEALLDRWSLPFEIASVLLIAAMIGALVLVRSADQPAEIEADQPAMDISDDDLPRDPHADERALTAAGRE
jgi:NADH:ubiquinone oxidoreductase subunit 6 (subunit J)